MLTRQKRYGLCLSRIFLLIGYLPFFAGPFNGRYFGIVNFYVFEHEAGAAGQQRTVATLGITLHDNSGQPAHLAVDKRFHLKQVVRVAQIHAPRVFCITAASHRVAAPSPDYFSAPSSTNGLRGPPCTA